MQERGISASFALRYAASCGVLDPKGIKIEKTENPLEQIDILLREVNNRSENDYYIHELKRLNVLFSSSINGENNKSMVERYRNSLKFELQEIYENVQNMTFNELKRDGLLHGKLPREYRYSYSSVCESIYAKGCKIPIGINKLDEYIKDFFDPGLWKNNNELYTLVEATIYFKATE